MKFSLVIPYYNRADFLPRTLASIAASTLRPTSIILVDNGSTDASEDICRKFQTAHPELAVTLLREERSGVCFARNLALSQVDTEWVYFFDSDDELSADYFQDVAQAVAAHSEAQLIASATRMVYPNGTSEVRKVQYTISPVDQILSGQLSTQSMFFRTDFLREIGGWNEKLRKWNDWELGLRVSLHAPHTYWLPAAYHQIYQHEQSLTGVGFSSTFPQIYEALLEAAALVNNDRACQLALASRCIFLAGQFVRERKNALSSCLWTFVRSQLHPTKIQSIFFHLLHLYVCCGGRGAWYISRKILPHL